MAVVKVEHSGLPEHQVGIMQQFREFWMEGHFCDLTVKSREGTEHRAHAGVLSAAGKFFKTLLCGSFLEADQVKHGQPVQINASDAALRALLEYIYGGQPDLPVEESIELLRLAGAYELPKLAKDVEAGIRASLKTHPVPSSLRVLQETHGLHDLKAACEEAVATNFEVCAQHPDFLRLSAVQLAQILERDDLKVSREEVVLKGIFTWFNSCKDRGDDVLGLLLRDVDFQSISFENLHQLSRLASSFGPNGDFLQRRVNQAMQANRKRIQAEASDGFRPKRRCLQHWSPYMGSSSGGARKVLPRPSDSLCWHQGVLYATDFASSVLCWKPGDGDPRVVAGTGASVAGFNELSDNIRVSVSPEGEIVVADRSNDSLISFLSGVGRVLVEEFEGLVDVSCSPNGVVYVLDCDGLRVQKLVGSNLQPVIASEDVSEEMQFQAASVFITREEILYLSDSHQGRILRIKPGEANPTVAGQLPDDEPSDPSGLFVTEEETIYVSDCRCHKVWVCHSHDTTCTEVLECPDGLRPGAILVQDRSLYVSMYKNIVEDDSWEGAVYEYFLPPDLQLK